MSDAEAQIGRLIGRLVSGRYRVVRPLGRGGFGTVYEAQDENPARTRRVAMKALRFDVFEDPERARRYLRREVDLLDRVSHPNIVRLFDVVEDQGSVFLIMELLRGRTLAERLNDGPLPPPEALRLTLAISDALWSLNREDCVHRDVKPANIFLADEGGLESVPKLMDFGLAADLFGSIQQSRDNVLGTLAYMPPEAFREGPPDDRYDVWSMGVVLHEMLLGRRPFGAPGDTEATIIGKILNADIPPLSGMPRRWATLLQDRLLVRNRAVRADFGTLINWLKAESKGRHELRVGHGSVKHVAMTRPAGDGQEHYVIRNDGGLRGARILGNPSRATLQHSSIEWAPSEDDESTSFMLQMGRWSITNGEVRKVLAGPAGSVEFASVDLGPSSGQALIAELLAAGLEDLSKTTPGTGAQLRLACELDGRPIDWAIPLGAAPDPSARVGELAWTRLAGPLKGSFGPAPAATLRLRGPLLATALAVAGLLSIAVISMSLAMLLSTQPEPVAAVVPEPAAPTIPAARPVPEPVVAKPDPTPAVAPPRVEPKAAAVIAKAVQPSPPLPTRLAVSPNEVTLVKSQTEVTLKIRGEGANCRQVAISGPQGRSIGTADRSGQSEVRLVLPTDLSKTLEVRGAANIGYRVRCADPETDWQSGSLRVEPFPEF
ncbi:MAG: protein kinase [Myxococcota bacterium]